MNTAEQVYFNKPQRLTQLIAANTTVIVAGRRTSKTDSIAVIISQDRPGSSNSLTLSWLLVDEAKFIKYEKLEDEARPYSFDLHMPHQQINPFVHFIFIYYMAVTP